MHAPLLNPSVVALLGLLMTAMPVLRAQAATATVTVLPLLRDGKPSEMLTQGAADRLLRLGEEPEPAHGSLSAAEQGCGTTSCLAPLAQRLHATRLVGGAVVASGQRRYTAKVFLYDSGTGRILNEERACDDCGERQLSTLVASLAARLVESGPAPGARAASGGAPPPRAPEPVPAAPAERRQGELTEAVKGQSATLAKVREAAEAAARSSDANGKLLDNVRITVDRTREGQDKLRDSQDRLREVTDKTRETTDKVRAATDKLRAEVERSRDSSDKAKESAERTRESAERARDLADRARASADRAREVAQSAQAAVERLNQSMDKTRESVDSGRSAAESARLQTEKLALVATRAAAAAESARAESVLAREAGMQASSVAGKTLVSVDQLNAISTDLRSALTNVEPLRAATEQTQQAAQVNTAKSAELLKLAESQRAAADDTLLRAEQTLRVLKEEHARRGLSRRRKVAAGVLGGLTALMLGASITMSGLDGLRLESCPFANGTISPCALNLSPGYVSIGYTLSALLGAATVAVLAVPSSSGG